MVSSWPAYATTGGSSRPCARKASGARESLGESGIGLPSREGRAIYPGVGPDARIAQSVTAREFKTAWAGGLGELSTGAMQARIGDTAAGSL